jgi:hypothetical protein
MSGAAISSITDGLNSFPQNSVNALFSSVDTVMFPSIVVAPVAWLGVCG